MYTDFEESAQQVGRKSERGRGLCVGGEGGARGGDSLNANRLVSSSSHSPLNLLLQCCRPCAHFPTCFNPLQTDIHTGDSLDSAFCAPALEVDPF